MLTVKLCMIANENGSHNSMTSIQNIESSFDYGIIQSSYSSTIKCSAFIIGIT